MEAEEVLEAVRKEFRLGGTPFKAYFDLCAVRVLTPKDSLTLTNEIFLNVEKRLIDLEAQEAKEA